MLIQKYYAYERHENIMKWNTIWDTKGISKKKSLTIRDFKFTFVVPSGHDNYRENLGHTIKGNGLVVFEQSQGND